MGRFSLNAFNFGSLQTLFERVVASAKIKSLFEGSRFVLIATNDNFNSFTQSVTQEQKAVYISHNTDEMAEPVLLEKKTIPHPLTAS